MPLLALVLLVLLAGCVTSVQGERYRGEYTYGHEVNVFCPAINSQCYWLGPNSSQAARERLKQIYHDKKPGLYKPVCVVIDGVIDHDSSRDGFAADYDGLIDIESVQGACDETSAITPGDLNHRRWVLAARNGVPVDVSEPPVVLDFGERMFVEGDDGCLHFSGFASIEGDRLSLGALDFDHSGCSAGDLSTRVFADRLEWRVVLADKGLSLSTGDARLEFERDDWR